MATDTIEQHLAEAQRALDAGSLDQARGHF